MSSPLKEFKHLRIPLQDIKSATNNFGESNYIGRGGFGTVYKGELVISDKLTMVAMKRLDTKLGQGTPEFLKEVMFLSTYKHENLVTLLGFCDEKGESILVYEFLSNKSLDLHLSSTYLSWSQRLRICIGAAKGLQYLHTPGEGSQHRVLHRDMKSANILLDHNWNPKISDFGLSKFGLANQPITYQYTAAVGTVGYCDPVYFQNYLLTKESDVYSFGVVLFEVLCGRQAIQVIKGVDGLNPLTVAARKCYKENTLSTIISASVKGKISFDCLERFSKIAYQCTQPERTQRPLMTEIVNELQIALEYQYEHERNMKLIKRGVALESNKDSDDFWETKLPTNLDVIIKMFKIPHSIYSIKKDLFFYLRKGLMFDGKKQYFWIDEYGKKCVLVSAEKVISPTENLNITWQSYMYHPRYYSILAVICNEKFRNVKCDIKTSMLSLGTWYTATLLFKFHFPASNLELIKIKWKTQELSVCSTHVAKLSNNWYTIPMWNFINRMLQADFYIVLEEFSIQHSSYNPHEILIQGFEFRPTNMNFNLQKKQNIIDMDNDDDEYWEKMLPDEYQSLVNLSDEPLKYTTKKELYLRLCEGFLGHHGNRRMWFFLNKSARGICLMLPAKDMLEDSILNTHTVSGSRFCEVIKITSIPKLIFKCSLETFMFTPHYIYECYFVFKFQHNQTSPDDTRFLRSYCEIDSVYQGEMSVYMNLYPFNIPTIKPTNDDGSHIELSNTPLYDRVEMQKHYKSSTIIERNDGWMEFMLCKPLHQLQDHKLLRVELYGETNETFNGMIVEGIEFRPLS